MISFYASRIFSLIVIGLSIRNGDVKGVTPDLRQWKMWGIAQCYTRNCYYFNNEVTFESTLMQCPPTSWSVTINVEFRNSDELYEFVKYVVSIRPDLYDSMVFINMSCTSVTVCKWFPENKPATYMIWDDSRNKVVTGVFFIPLKHNNSRVAIANTPRLTLPRFARFCMGPKVKLTTKSSKNWFQSKGFSSNRFWFIPIIILLLGIEMGHFGENV